MHIVTYDPSATVPNQVTGIFFGITAPESNCLVDPDMSAVQGIDQRYYKVVDGAVVEMTTVEKGVLDLPDLKAAKILEIQNRTLTEEAAGVPYDGYRFSTSAEAKANWLAIVVAKDGLTYPFSVPTGFGVIYSFVNADSVLGFFATSMAFIKYWEQSNAELILAVDGCTTAEAVAAIMDDRAYPSA